MMRGKQVNRLKKKLLYNYSSKVQTLGPGSVTINITNQVDQAMTGLSYLELSSIISGSADWDGYSKNFRIYKIEQIAVTFYPNDALDNAPTYLALDWFSNVFTADSIQTYDATKIVYNDQKKIKPFFFKPPNMIINGRNYRQFNTTTIASLPPVKLYFYQSSGNMKCRIDIRMVFKVPSDYVITNKLKLKNAEDLAKIDEDKMLDSTLKTMNNMRLVGVHNESFSIDPEEKEEEKLEGDDEDEEPKIITKKEDPTWSLFEQICREDEEKEEKKKEKNRKKMLKRKERRKKKKEKLAALEKNKKNKETKRKI